MVGKYVFKIDSNLLMHFIQKRVNWFALHLTCTHYKPILSRRHQSNELQNKPIYWFLYDRKICRECGKIFNKLRVAFITKLETLIFKFKTAFCFAGQTCRNSKKLMFNSLLLVLKFPELKSNKILFYFHGNFMNQIRQNLTSTDI